MTFAMVIERRPPSSQSGPNRKFQEAVRGRASLRWGSQALLEGDLYARIIWFYSAPKVGDIDNIPKNILDALNGTVYADDRSIVQITILRVKMGDIDFRANTLPEEVRQQIFIELTEALAYGPDHLLYIEVGSVKERRVSFGPVDGGMR